MTPLNPPGLVSKTNNNTDMMNYAEMLTKCDTPYNLNKSILPKSSLKINFTVSYDINTTNEFPHITNNNKKQNKPSARSREAMGLVADTTTTASVSKEDNFSTLLELNNRPEQANTAKIISDNNETNKLTFLHMLEENNNKNQTGNHEDYQIDDGGKE